MVECPRGDCCEKATLGEPSPGVIDDNERLVRGAYEELHYKKGFVALKDAFPREKDVRNGELSIWRLDKGLKGNVAEARELVAKHGPANKTLRECIIFEAHDLRQIETIDQRRALCLKDDTIIDGDGNGHPEHAALGLCVDLPKNEYEIGSEPLLLVVRSITAYANLRRSRGFVL